MNQNEFKKNLHCRIVGGEIISEDTIYEEGKRFGFKLGQITDITNELKGTLSRSHVLGRIAPDIESCRIYDKNKGESIYYLQKRTTPEKDKEIRVSYVSYCNNILDPINRFEQAGLYDLEYFVRHRQKSLKPR